MKDSFSSHGASKSTDVGSVAAPAYAGADAAENASKFSTPQKVRRSSSRNRSPDSTFFDMDLGDADESTAPNSVLQATAPTWIPSPAAPVWTPTMPEPSYVQAGRPFHQSTDGISAPGRRQVGPERRYDGDFAYTLEEFCRFYGRFSGTQRWSRARRAEF